MASAEPITLIVVLTAGNQRDKNQSLVPTETGKLRLKTAAEMRSEITRSRIMSLGGKRGATAYCEANVYDRYGRDNHHKAFANAIWMATAKYTAKDVTDLAEILPKLQAEIGKIDMVIFVTHPKHGKLAKLSFLHALKDPKDLLVRIVPSGEPQPYSGLTQLILEIVTKLDPGWKTFLTLPFRFLANRRGRYE